MVSLDEYIANGTRPYDRPAGDAAPPVRSLTLVRRFIEDLASDLEDARRGSEAEDRPPVLDWDVLRDSAQGAESLEQAVGRVVMAADRLTRDAAAELRSRQATRVPPKAAAPTLDGSAGVPAADHEMAAASVPAPFVMAPPVGAAPATGRRRWTRARVASILGWVQFTGILICLFALWQLWGTGIAQAHAQDSAKPVFAAEIAAAGPRPAVPTLIPASANVPVPAEGTVVARLQIPKIGVDQYVVEGTAEGDLAKGPGHYDGTAMPGQAGNVAIAGHRTTYGAPFYDLNELVPGDEIVLTTDTGIVLHYVESQVPVPVSPTDVAVLGSFNDNRLTLTTCNPRYSASQRLVAVATLQTPVVTQSTTAVVTQPTSPVSQQDPAPRPQAHHQIVADSLGWHPLYLPEAALFFALLVGLCVTNRRVAIYLGRRFRWLVFLPLWVGVIYLLFGALTKLLPATL